MRTIIANSNHQLRTASIASLASLAIMLLAGCETAPPVREYNVYHTSRVAPVGERTYVLSPIVFTRPVDRSYDIMNKNWERPWPYGPYGRGW
ncbi:MAG: hypothetical protein WCP06_00095 [Verrucomicrobiota bacterium]